MPAFKEHAKLVDPSDLVVGRQYLIKYVQNENPPFTGIFLETNHLDGFFKVHLIDHIVFGAGQEQFFLLYDKQFFNLDEVMEEA